MQTSQGERRRHVDGRSAWRRLRQVSDVLGFVLTSAGRSAWRKLKNCIKFIIGRETTFDETGLFLRQYVLHVTGIRPIRKITCTGLRSEGAGSQAFMIMNAINFARSNGFEYVHTAFRFIAHAERPMEEWAAAWEELFNLGWGELPCNDEREEVVDFCYNFTGLGQCFGWRWRWDETADSFRATIPEFRRKYYRNKSLGKPNQFTVAVHIRRGDVSAGNEDYFTSNEAIVRTIITAQSALRACDVQHRICVYSQGNSAEFADFSRLGAELCLNGDAVWTMEELIKGDVLIMAKGCYSYCAGLISEGIKIFEPDPVPDHDVLPGWKWRAIAPAENWIACKPDGSFDVRAFKRQLAFLTEAKAKGGVNG